METPNEKYGQLASSEQINRTVEGLKKNGFNVEVVDNSEQAREVVLNLIPQGAEVMNMTSVTLDATGISKKILESDKYKAVRNKLNDPTAPPREKKKLGAAPEYAVGSAHAVTEHGSVMIASNTGSQLPAYAYGADKIIWVISTKKLVKDLDEGFKRIYGYTLPLESQRANKAYNITSGSSVNKLLIVNKEIAPDRITVILVKQNLGF